MGIKAPGSGKGDAAYDTAKSRLREAAARHLWTKSSASGWVWWNYLPLEASETDLDAYAVRHVEGLVDAWKALDSENPNVAAAASTATAVAVACALFAKISISAHSRSDED